MHRYHSTSLDPCWNLATEDYLLDQAARRGPMLLTWRSHDSVVLGKNQNPWRECDLAWMGRNEVLLARRITGGGAVFHDQGNLNYTFFCARSRYDQDAVYAALLQGLRSVGVPAERMGKSSLSVDGRKISGNAFCYRRDGVLQHGTLLISSRLERLNRCLRPSIPDLVTRAVASEPAPVANLSELDAGWSLERIEDAVVQGFSDAYGPVSAESLTDDLEPVSMNRLHLRFLSDAWRLDRTPRFTVSLAPSVSGPRREVELTVDRGRIVEAAGMPGLVGRAFRAADIASAWPEPMPREATEAWLCSLGI